MKFLLKLLCSVMIFGSMFSISLAQKDPVGITLTGNCLTGVGKDCFQYGNILGINKYQKQNYSALSIVKDVAFAAMYMVGTVLTLVIIVCGIGYILAARDAKEVNRYKNGLKYAAIGAILVRGALSIIRLIQYIASGV